MYMTKVHLPPMNKFACKLHGYIVYFIIKFNRSNRYHYLPVLDVFASVGHATLITVLKKSTMLGNSYPGSGTLFGQIAAFMRKS